MVKGSGIGSFGGGALEHPRQWLGAQWAGLSPGSAESPRATESHRAGPSWGAAKGVPLTMLLHPTPNPNPNPNPNPTPNPTPNPNPNPNPNFDPAAAPILSMRLSAGMPALDWALLSMAPVSLILDPG